MMKYWRRHESSGVDVRIWRGLSFLSSASNPSFVVRGWAPFPAAAMIDGDGVLKK